MPPTSSKSNPFEEACFGRWCGSHGVRDPDNPRHFYDFRRAFKEGAEPDEVGHWPSKYKVLGNPRRFVKGFDTVTGKMATRGDMLANELARQAVLRGYDPRVMEGGGRNAR